jgi:hypothetical protein
MTAPPRPLADPPPLVRAAFAALDQAGMPATLVGRGLRVPGATPAKVTEALGPVDPTARVSESPATLEERFFELTTAATAAAG